MTQAAQAVKIITHETGRDRVMKVSAVLFTFLALTGLSLEVSGLDPGSYGTGEDPSTKEGYKTAYARAKAAREMAFAKKAENAGAVAPQEEIMQQDYQVLNQLFIFSFTQCQSCCRSDTQSQWSQDLNPASSSRIWRWVT